MLWTGTVLYAVHAAAAAAAACNQHPLAAQHQQSSHKKTHLQSFIVFQGSKLAGVYLVQCYLNPFMPVAAKTTQLIIWVIYIQ